jgi:hypothetical protein
MSSHDAIIRNAEEWLKGVFCALGTPCTKSFSGLGLILYHSTHALPVLPLTHSESELPLPTMGLEDSVRLLHTLCQFDSPFHDGFHLVEAESLSITHVSQFFSPPIPEIVPQSPTNHAVGARFMSAWLGSYLPAVCMAATLSRVEGGLVFERGVIRTLFTAKQ